MSQRLLNSLSSLLQHCVYRQPLQKRKCVIYNLLYTKSWDFARLKLDIKQSLWISGVEFGMSETKAKPTASFTVLKELVRITPMGKKMQYTYKTNKTMERKSDHHDNIYFQRKLLLLMQL